MSIYNNSTLYAYKADSLTRGLRRQAALRSLAAGPHWLALGHVMRPRDASVAPSAFGGLVAFRRRRSWLLASLSCCVCAEYPRRAMVSIRVFLTRSTAIRDRRGGLRARRIMLRRLTEFHDRSSQINRDFCVPNRLAVRRARTRARRRRRRSRARLGPACRWVVTARRWTCHDGSAESIRKRTHALVLLVSRVSDRFGFFSSSLSPSHAALQVKSSWLARKIPAELRALATGEALFGVPRLPRIRKPRFSLYTRHAEASRSERAETVYFSNTSRAASNRFQTRERDGERLTGLSSIKITRFPGIVSATHCESTINFCRASPVSRSRQFDFCVQSEAPTSDASEASFPFAFVVFVPAVVIDTLDAGFFFLLFFFI